MQEHGREPLHLASEISAVSLRSVGIAAFFSNDGAAFIAGQVISVSGDLIMHG